MKVILDSEIILNTDIGVINLINKVFNDNEVFDMNKINKMSSDILIMAEIIITRTTINPLSIIIRDDYLDKIDTIYTELIRNNLEDIVKLSKYTAVKRLVDILILNNNLQPTILCRNKEIQGFFKKEFHKVPTIINQDYDIDISDYDAIYVDKYKDILNFKNLYGKNIYISNARYNLEQDLNTPLMEVSLEINNANKINIIDIYYLNKNNAQFEEETDNGK